jgi:hypothetical protein
MNISWLDYAPRSNLDYPRPLSTHHSSSTNINQHQPTSTNINQHQPTSTNINQHQPTSTNTSPILFDNVLRTTPGAKKKAAL